MSEKKTKSSIAKLGAKKSPKRVATPVSKPSRKAAGVKSRSAAPKKKASSLPLKALDPENAAAEFEVAIANVKKGKTGRYVLRLYITGTSARSVAAITNIRKLCEEHLAGKYDLEVIDIYQQPVLASGDQIIAAPTLIKKFPIPLRKVVGDLSNEDRILIGLDLIPRKNP